MIKILVVEDDFQLNKLICRYLKDSGFDPRGCLNMTQAYEALYHNLYDLIISDIMLPDTDGFALAEAIRSINEKIPILFISALDDFSAKQKAFRACVDDYMVKPINLDELLLRVNALLRRANIEAQRKIVVGNLCLDADAVTVKIGGQEVALTKREFKLLYKFLSYPGKTFSRAQLMDEFWSMDSDSGLRSVDVYITKLRGKLSDCDGFSIVTVRGLGYKAVLK